MFDPNNMVRKDFISRIGKYEVNMVALFNITKISEADVVKIIKSGEEDDRVLIVSKKKFLGVFEE
jgi:hypothetical protein